MPAKNDESEQLLLAIQNDNHFAFSRLFDLYKAKIFNFALKFVIDESNADEITQMVFVKLWEKRKKISISVSIDSFLFVLTRNTCFDFLRKISHDKKLMESFLLAYQRDANYADDVALHLEMSSCLDMAIGKLPQKQRDVFIMAEIEKKSYDEIARDMLISKNTVKTQLKLARVFLKKTLLQKGAVIGAFIILFIEFI
jgi:RNA polymerase sigma-70 factor (family 1)